MDIINKINEMLKDVNSIEPGIIKAIATTAKENDMPMVENIVNALKTGLTMKEAVNEIRTFKRVVPEQNEQLLNEDCDSKTISPNELEKALNAIEDRSYDKTRSVRSNLSRKSYNDEVKHESSDIMYENQGEAPYEGDSEDDYFVGGGPVEDCIDDIETCDDCCKLEPEDLEPEDDSIKTETDIIGYLTPHSLFRRNIKFNTLYILKSRENNLYGPVDNNDSKYELPYELIKDWKKVVNGSKGQYMELTREGDSKNLEIRYDANYIYYGGQRTKFAELQKVVTGIQLINNMTKLDWDISIRYVDIGCQTQIWVSSILELYKNMLKLQK